MVSHAYATVFIYPAALADMEQDSATRVCIVQNVKIEGKATPVRTWTGPEGSRRLRLPDFETIGT